MKFIALVLAALLAATFPVSAQADDWTPVHPEPAGCADNGWRLTKVDDYFVKAVNPQMADWQIGRFRLAGIPLAWTVKRQVVDEPHCQAFRVVLVAPYDGQRFMHYRWFGADGNLLESGWKKVRR